MLQTVLKYMPLKATMREVEIPGLSSGDITFHGVVSSQEFQSIIVNAKVLVLSYCCLILHTHRRFVYHEYIQQYIVLCSVFGSVACVNGFTILTRR